MGTFNSYTLRSCDDGDETNFFAGPRRFVENTRGVVWEENVGRTLRCVWTISDDKIAKVKLTRFQLGSLYLCIWCINTV